jgi:beta-lactamase class A
MNGLVMDGVRPPRAGTVNAGAFSAFNASSSQATVIAPPLLQTAALVDGIRRPRGLYTKAATPEPVVELGQSEVELDQLFAKSAVRSRYRIAAVAAAGLMVPLLTIPAYRLSVSYIAGRELPAVAPVAANTAPMAQPTPAAAQPQSDPGLQALLQQFTASGGANYGIVIKDLKSGIVTSSNREQVFTSASLYKLFVAHGIYKLIDSGELSLGDPVRGTGHNVESCLRIMINVSDNTCGRALGTLLGWGKQNDNLANLGFAHTSLSAPQQTSAGDVALLLERLYNGTLLSPSSSDQFLGLLKEQRVNNRLPVGLPAGTAIAHKTGDLNGFVHDAGIVYGQKTNYLIVTTSGPWSKPSQAPAKFAELSAKVYAHLNQ